MSSEQLKDATMQLDRIGFEHAGSTAGSTEGEAATPIGDDAAAMGRKGATQRGSTVRKVTFADGVRGRGDSTVADDAGTKGVVSAMLLQRQQQRKLQVQVKLQARALAQSGAPQGTKAAPSVAGGMLPNGVTGVASQLAKAEPVPHVTPNRPPTHPHPPVAAVAPVSASASVSAGSAAKLPHPPPSATMACALPPVPSAAAAAQSVTQRPQEATPSALIPMAATALAIAGSGLSEGQRQAQREMSRFEALLQTHVVATDARLDQVEERIERREDEYIGKTWSHGNVMRGWESFARRVDRQADKDGCGGSGGGASGGGSSGVGGASAGPKLRKARAGDRMFSLSSASSRFRRENPDALAHKRGGAIQKKKKKKRA